MCLLVCLVIGGYRMYVSVLVRIMGVIVFGCLVYLISFGVVGSGVGVF